jgi:hypothetical protein
MFEALRGLRDAATLDEDNDNEMATTTATSTVTTPTNSNNIQQVQQLQDSALVLQLVDAVFEKSNAIDRMLDNNFHNDSENNKNSSNQDTEAPTVNERNKTPPLFTNRTKEQQMAYIQALIDENNCIVQELYGIVEETIQQRDQCRHYIIQNDTIIDELQQQQQQPF